MNKESTEVGGFIQKGSIGEHGKIDAGLSLAFDRFRQDQTLQLICTDSANHQSTGIRINDVQMVKTTSLDDMKKFVAEAEKLQAAEQAAY